MKSDEKWRTAESSPPEGTEDLEGQVKTYLALKTPHSHVFLFFFFWGGEGARLGLD